MHMKVRHSLAGGGAIVNPDVETVRPESSLQHRAGLRQQLAQFPTRSTTVKSNSGATCRCCRAGMWHV